MENEFAQHTFRFSELFKCLISNYCCRALLR